MNIYKCAKVFDSFALLLSGRNVTSHLLLQVHAAVIDTAPGTTVRIACLKITYFPFVTVYCLPSYSNVDWSPVLVHQNIIACGIRPWNSLTQMYKRSFHKVRIFANFRKRLVYMVTYACARACVC